MNKNKVIALVMSAMMVMPTVAYAKGNDKEKGKPDIQIPRVEQKSDKTIFNQSTSVTTSSPKSEVTSDKGKSKGEEKKNDAQEKRDEKKTEIANFKAQMKLKHEQMKAIQKETRDLKKQAEDKKEQISLIIADLQSGKKTLPEDMLKALISESQNVLLDSKAVKATSEVSKDAEDTQAKIKGHDFNNALASLDKVIAKLQARKAALIQLNADLDAMLKIANLATTPAPVDATQPSTSTDTTTPSDTTTPADTTTTTPAPTVPTGDTQTTTQPADSTTTTN